ncbi:hypothetical protein IMZ48_07955 [Candidatus Bathyarchaeota archaeon]|nr:hypothetical protein [Candidatus Bathyarchaeota archaeon]
MRGSGPITCLTRGSAKSLQYPTTSPHGFGGCSRHPNDPPPTTPSACILATALRTTAAHQHALGKPCRPFLGDGPTPARPDNRSIATTANCRAPQPSIRRRPSLAPTSPTGTTSYDLAWCLSPRGAS